MGRVVVLVSVSLDGYFSGPQGELDWQSIDEELHAHLNDELRDAGGFLEGRVTWELMADYWPAAAENPDQPPVIQDFGRIWLATPKAVWSTTLPDEAPWGTAVWRAFDPDQVRRFAAGTDGDVFVGGRRPVAGCREHGLVDEYRVYVHPTLLGQGVRLLDGAHEDLELVEQRRFTSGVVLLRYAVRRASPAG